jgi:diketogulonate reductase-like aldo/keto reductase
MSSASLPRFLYGTAWKEDRTEELAGLALTAGFRGIDTANQRRHYFEAGVGAALAAAQERGLVAREDVFLQQSFQSSLEHLRTRYVDSYVLHGPSSARGLTAFDWAVWRAMEDRHRSKTALRLGISNVSLEQLVTLHEGSAVKPAFVQNRCFARSGWDGEVRRFCTETGMVYQGFSLLTANPRALASAAVQAAARRCGRTPAQVVFRFALEVGMLPLTGTTDPGHMRDDLDAAEFALRPEEVAAIEICETPGGSPLIHDRPRLR